MYCVTVEFKVRPEDSVSFLARMVRQAADSLSNEPGCHIFDVWTSAERPHSVFLYEIYNDLAAFEDHVASDHFKSFDTDVAPWVLEKSATTWEQKR
ncbi:putative quinol monooxygenase [Algihabitans albus]|uniref:putative quinol monooxygenase n=1 Tax=Algihabitans albus TaxID=2164067 RepID=UPI000E5D9816|nr:antibiotic biosynthesis monooxygenase family protein [Algihabitans albus]